MDSALAKRSVVQQAFVDSVRLEYSGMLADRYQLAFQFGQNTTNFTNLAVLSDHIFVYTSGNALHAVDTSTSAVTRLSLQA